MIVVGKEASRSDAVYETPGLATTQLLMVFERPPGTDVPAKPIVVDPRDHSMGSRLPQYIATRVHEWVAEQAYSEIVVFGSFDRSHCCSRKEKRDKRENWQRPTAQVAGDTLRIHCFPGRAYVFHYGSLVASQLALSGRDHGVVRIELPDPATIEAQLMSGGLTAVPVTQTIVVAAGNDYLAPLGARWIDYGSCLARTEDIGKNRVTWLAVKHSFWGDIAYHLGRILAGRGFKKILFTGKLVSLVVNHRPNRTLASGTASVVSGKVVTWESLLGVEATIVTGRHITLPSVLQETNEWAVKASSDFSFVDPEIGNYAAGVLSGGARFSYLHIVSDNLGKRYSEDLSNERTPMVRRARATLYDRLGLVLRRHLAACH